MPIVKIVNKSPFPLPAYATEGASGLDLRAHLPAPITLQSLERQLVPTGLFLEIPAGHEVQVRPRSGLALHKGISCLNSPGTVDADYRGELKVILVNLSNEPTTIEPGERIAQMVLQKVEKVQWEPTEQLASSARNQGGFGHTGRH